MIYFELLRYSTSDTSLGQALTNAFARFADSREQAERRLLLTHLYLLIGLGIATNLTWIMIGGGFPDGELTIFAYSGVAFLGVLDTAAALMGKNFGASFWRKHAHRKTTEGTIYALVFTCIVYYVFCARVYEPFCAEFAIVFFATFLASIVEGWTT